MKCSRWWSGAGICLALALGVTAVGRAAEEANDQVVSLVLELLNEKDKDLRAAGLDQIRSDAKGAAATKKFAAQLPKLSPEAQTGLLSALAERGDTSARPAVIELLQSTDNESVKVAAIGAVGALGDGGDLPLLLRFLSADSKAEATAARAAVVRLRGEKVNAAIIATVKESKGGPLRKALIEILATRHALELLPDLCQLAVDEDAAARGAAMAALGQFGSAAQIPAMVQGVLKTQKGGERDAAERAIVLICSRTPAGTDRATALIAATDKLSASDRGVVLSALGRVGGPAALAVVETALADPTQHEAGLRALCNWPDASVARRLLEIAEASKQPEDRAAALAALIRIAPLPDGRPDAERLALLTKMMEMSSDSEDQNRILQRARAIRTIDTLRFVAPYLDQPDHAQMACETVVELAHHRELRDANKAEFTAALDKVIKTSKDPVVVDRATRYKAGKTWTR